jgi:hypothetical protein
VPADAIGVIWFQAEPGSGEAAFDEGGLVLDFPQAVPDDLQQVAAGQPATETEAEPPPGTRI